MAAALPEEGFADQGIARDSERTSESDVVVFARPDVMDQSFCRELTLSAKSKLLRNRRSMFFSSRWIYFDLPSMMY